MELITDSKDERLKVVVSTDERDAIDYVKLLYYSLRAALEREKAYSRSILVDKIVELEGELCRAREVIKFLREQYGVYFHSYTHEQIGAAFSSSTPCPHEVQLAIYKESYEQQLILKEGKSEVNEELRGENKRLREAV